MKKILYIKLLLWLVIVAALTVGAVYVWRSITRTDSGPEVYVRPAVIRDVREMARLCTVEIYSELPVQDTIDNKVIVAVQKQHGTVSFDIDRLDIEDSADTIRTTLPPEIVELYETTDENAYTVIDTKGIGLLVTDRLTNDQDNRFKQRLKRRSIERLYRDGVIANARKEARRQLAQLLSNAYRRTVVVRDTIPRGKKVTLID